MTRTSTYTPEIGAEICRRIAEGEPLSKITGPGRKRGFPARVTIYDWLLRHDEFRVAYCLARLAQAELYAEQVIEISDGVDEGGGSAPRDTARDRLRVESRRWLAAVMTPHVYERLAQLGEAQLAARKPIDVMHMGARIAAILEEVRRRKAAAAEAEVAAAGEGEPMSTSRPIGWRDEENQ